MTDLPACFDLFERSAVRIETLPAYDVPAEAEVLRAFARGLPLPERSTRTSPWLARIAQTTAAGKSWSRTRVTGWPLTVVRAVPARLRLPAVRAGGRGDPGRQPRRRTRSWPRSAATSGCSTVTPPARSRP